MRFEQLFAKRRKEPPASRDGSRHGASAAGVPLFLRRPRAEGSLEKSIGATNDQAEAQADATAKRVTGAGAETESSQTLARTPSARIPPESPQIVQDVLQRSGRPLDRASRAYFEPRLGQNLGFVRIHTDARAARSAQAIGARAYAVGRDVVFGAGEYAPSTHAGRILLAHELAHLLHPRGEKIRRTVEMRDVGRGEQSGFARLPELIERLNRVANGLVFTLANNDLAYQENPYGTATEFERQMRGFIDSATPIRLRLTNRQGLLGTRAAGFHTRVFIDAFSSGYVDIDDLLAADDLNLQTSLVHLLAERASVKDYTRRIGTDFTEGEFNRGHQLGLDAETRVLQDFFGDHSIRFSFEPDSGPFDRVWTNSRRDLIRERHRDAGGGVDILSMEVLLRDGRTLTADQYRALLAGAPAGANL